MPLELVTVPCLEDNYAFLVHDAKSGETAVIDVPEAGPIKAALAARGWTLSHVLLTHHHWDHVDGLPDLLADHPARVVGAAADAHRLPPLDLAVTEGDSFRLGSDSFEVLDVSGHTIGHIAFYTPESKLVFTADSLMALGCGRLFEGTPAQMLESMAKLAALPGDTTVCSGHEYTTTNAKFAATVDPQNPALISRIQDIAEKRAAGMPTVPSRLQLEMDTNPFLRASDPAIAAHLEMADSTPLDVFTEIRARRDRF
ncbi:hydroxyacylglutathione hydrolase [Pseudosulfitobacter sp. DSM 107133]|uniref:hydroxyacylglutathione hydrolase n=1 Tax=Pseudosulfitobacter sp. DSM 107133 TaxID=2883100 RepID=UPI0019651646|nr:hydroxyacylglutathione hydrolase [Pseudosulfitobacter sp. DSM 107133]UOA28098.1 Hydroxyacylglutathione hydrolase GloB [Pseudosulfitobacter sp. DSM 107133]